MTATLSLVMLCLLPAADGLDSPSFRVRERATKALRRCGILAWPTLARAETISCEAAKRAALIGPDRKICWAEARAVVLLDKQGQLPWLSFAGNYSDGEHELVREAEAAGEGKFESGRAPADQFPSWRAATRRWVFAVMRAGMEEAEVLLRLADMRRAERRYLNMPDD